MSETPNTSTPNSGLAPLKGRAEALIGTMQTRLKDLRTSFQEGPVTATEASFSDDAHEAAAKVEARLRPATDRAEESLDRAGERLGAFAATLSHRVRKAVALAREEAEDILAEAQDLRRNDVS